MRKAFLIPLIVLSNMAWSQSKYQFSKSVVSFYSEAPIETIEAKSTETKGLVDFTAKTFFVNLAISTFEFKSSLMKEHFNENYMESEKFPKGTFKGVFTEAVDLTKDGSYTVNATGDLTIHGVAQKRTVPVTITVHSGVAKVHSVFNVKIADHKIEIPKLVFQKIAEEVKITIDSDLAIVTK